MTKKILSLLLALTLAVALVSCGGEDASESTDTETVAETTVATEFDLYVPGHDENAAEPAVYTANYALSNAQLLYLVQSAYQNLIYNVQVYYNGDFSSFGLDVSEPLKDQPCGIDESAGTWLDYFVDSAVAEASEILAVCEAAAAAGYTLPDEAQSEIDAMFDELLVYAEDEGVTVEEYLVNNFGADITVEVLEDTMKKSYLAQYYINDCIESLDLSDDVLEAKYRENPDIADSVDYMLFSLDYNELIPEDADEAAVEEALNTCRAAASEIAKSTDEESFKAAVKKCLVDTFGYSEGDAAAELETLVYEDAAYSEDSVLKWLFDAEAGDAGVIEDEEYGAVYVCYLTARNGRDESISGRNVRHILFTHDSYEDDTEVQKIYNKWVAGGASVKDFISLAAKHSEDPGSADAGGLYEKVYEGQMVDEFNDWLFDDARVPGDHAIVKSEQFGWHIMYYEGEAVEWKMAVKEYIQNETQLKVLEDAVKNYAVTVDEEAIATIPA